MKTELFTVSKIFTEALYRIPDYQRGYSWETNHLRDFWLDVEQLHSADKHYTGVLTIESVDQRIWESWNDDLWIIQARRYKPYYVVDGQQRLTTAIILIQTILEDDRPGQLNFTTREDVRRKYIFDTKPEDAARSYIFGYEKDNPSYEYLKKKIFGEDSDVHFPSEDTIYTKNLLAARTFFKSRIEKLSLGELEDLFTKVTQQLVFNVYEITSDIDVFVAFETMNNRGKPLSTLELLKNRLIFLSTKLPTPQNRDGALRRLINEAWKSAYHFLGKNDKRPLSDDEFLRTHLALYYLSVLKGVRKDDDENKVGDVRAYFETLEDFNRFLLTDLFSQKRIKKPAIVDEPDASKKPALNLPQLDHAFISSYASNIKSSVELYYQLSNPKDASLSSDEIIWLERIGRMAGFSPSATLLALFKLEKNSAKRVRALEVLERYHFFLSIRVPHYNYRRYRLSTDENFIGYASGFSSLDNMLVLMENQLAGFIKDTPLSEAMSDWVKNGEGYYSWRSIKYFLFEYELELQRKMSPNRSKIDWDDFFKEDFQRDYETVEHIYPQRARDPYWTVKFGQFNIGQRKLIRNSLGNLLAISRPRNSSLSNKAFVVKRDDEKGYRVGSYSEIEVAKYDDWGLEQVVERGIHLLEFFERRWKLAIGDRTAKLQALGLSFIAKLELKGRA